MNCPISKFNVKQIATCIANFRLASWHNLPWEVCRLMWQLRWYLMRHEFGMLVMSYSLAKTWRMIQTCDVLLWLCLRSSFGLEFSAFHFLQLICQPENDRLLYSKMLAIFIVLQMGLSFRQIFRPLGNTYLIALKLCSYDASLMVTNSGKCGNCSIFSRSMETSLPSSCIAASSYAAMLPLAALAFLQICQPLFSFRSALLLVHYYHS